MRSFLAFLCLFCAPIFLLSQNDMEVIDYGEPREYEIGGIKVNGAYFSDDNALIGVTGLSVGDKIRIPGYDIPRAIRNLWKLRLFTDVQIRREKTVGDIIFLELYVEERPRLSRYSYRGVKKTTHDNLNDEVNKFLIKGSIVTENGKVNAAEAIESYYEDKGYLDAQVSVEEYNDSLRNNSVRLVFDVDRGPRVKIDEVEFVGNESISAKKLRKQMESTKKKGRIFGSSKFIREEYENDKSYIIDYYNTVGFRDARITGDTVWRDDKGELHLALIVDEGNRYYFRDISWKGNSVFTDEFLSQTLGIVKGDVYNEELLNTRLSFSQDNSDVSSRYMDNGYLFFEVEPVEVAVENDSMDLEMRIREGGQATISEVGIAGNDRTHEHVVRRELRTRPGAKFSRSDIIRSQRQIINLGYFNPEALGINTPVNPERGTVAIDYQVEEKPSDQLELSAGWGGRGRGVIGTLGVTFNNFSLRNLFNKEAWHPLPQGDGQRLSLRAQTNGDVFQSYNASFTEPWLGGKKPNSLTVAGFFNRFTNGRSNSASAQSLNIIQGSVSLGSRLSWPDDNFVVSTGINLQTLRLNNWFLTNVFRTDDGERVTDGNYNNFSLTQRIARVTVNDPLFPREGSEISLTVQLTPPYSLFREDGNPDDQTTQERFRWVEYHKWRFDANWYTSIVGKLVLKTSVKIGILGAYDRDLGVSPFERFQLGGDGINNQQFGFNGVDIISSRGYEIEDFPANRDPLNVNQDVATPIFDKFTVELRYPLSLNPTSTIYVHGFLQGANAWNSIRDFNPFDLRRSAGFGLRVFLPMFGMLGFDYGFALDDKFDPSANRGDFNIILGFEPE